MRLVLFSWPSSPYVRKVMLTAHELGMADRINLIRAECAEGEAELHRVNPIGKIPVLIVDDDLVIYESNTICRYLNSTTPTPNLFADWDDAPWHASNRLALTDAILDAATARVGESRRPGNLQSTDFDNVLAARIARCLDALEPAPDYDRDHITISTLTLATALAYLDFRLPSQQWRSRHTSLATWFAEFSQRQSMRATEFWELPS